MHKKIRSIVVFCLLLSLFTYTTVRANPLSAKEAKFAAKVKAEIMKLGTGPDARIKVKLRDKTKLKGYVSEVGEDTFTVVNDKTGVAVKVSYSQAKQVKGNNLSTGVIVAVGVLLVIVLAIVIGTLAKEND